MDKNKNVVFLINSLGVGGAERVFIKDANALSAEGFDVYFAILFGGEEKQPLLSELKLPRERIFFMKAQSIFDVAALGRLRSFIAQEKITTIYSTLNEANVVARLVKCVSYGVSVIIREANVADEKSIKYKLLDLVLNIFTNKIVGVSSAVVESLKRYQPFFGYKMKVLMNGVEIPPRQKSYEAMSGPLQILNVGSLTPKKGQRYLIEASALVQAEKPNSFHLTIVGSGREASSLRDLVKERGLESVVTFMPTLSAKEVSEKYLASDVFVLSSLWEGCPNVLLEAMAHGVAPIATDVSGVWDAIQDGISGIIIPKQDAHTLAHSLMRVLEDRAVLGAYGAAARSAMMRSFGVSEHVRQLKEMLLQ